MKRCVNSCRCTRTDFPQKAWDDASSAFDEIVAAVTGDSGHEPTDEESHWLGIEPDSAHTPAEELPDALREPRAEPASIVVRRIRAGTVFDRENAQYLLLVKTLTRQPEGTDP